MRVAEPPDSQCQVAQVAEGMMRLNMHGASAHLAGKALDPTGFYSVSKAVVRIVLLGIAAAPDTNVCTRLQNGLGCSSIPPARSSASLGGTPPRVSGGSTHHHRFCSFAALIASRGVA